MKKVDYICDRCGKLCRDHADRFNVLLLADRDSKKGEVLDFCTECFRKVSCFMRGLEETK